MSEETRPTEDSGFPSEGFVQPGGRAGSEPVSESEIGPYHLLSVLGEGGFGVVHLAEQREPVRRRVALKVIKPGMDSKAVIARFQAERQALALMDHENIARVFDAGTTARGLPYFVMEYVRGAPITAHCDEQRLSVADRVALFRQVCEAVQHAHQKGVLHRDLKPTNVLIERRDGRSVPKVIDFGVAKALHQPLTDATIFTRQGQLIGTPEYMSPEQAEGSEDVDTRSDIYSLGVILYELISGVRPAPAISTDRQSASSAAGASVVKPSRRIVEIPQESGQTAESIARSRSTDSRSLTKTLRNDLDWIVMRCLEPDRDRRYESAAALGADLRRYLSSEPVLAGPPTTSYRLRSFMRRHRVGVTAAAAIGIALILGLSAAVFGLVRATQERDIARNAQAQESQARGEAESVLEFLTTMLASAEPGEGASDVTVREILDDAAAKIVAGSMKDQPVAEGRLRYAIGRAYLELGHLPEAENHLERSDQLLHDHLADDDYLTIRTMNDLARLRHVQGDMETAAEMFAMIIPRARGTLGDDHQLTLTMLNNLAAIRYEQGRLEEAAAAFRQTLEVLEGTLGDDHRRTLICRSNLAAVYQVLDHYEDAEREYLKIIEVRTRLLGADHHDTLHTMTLLASLYNETGQSEKAEPMLRNILALRRESLGADHPVTIRVQTSLASVLSRIERLEDAESVIRDAIARYTRVLGADHADTAYARVNLGMILREKGHTEEALSTLLESVESLRRAHSPGHHLVGYALESVGYCFVILRKTDEAIAAFSEAYEIISASSLGPGHEVALRSAGALSGIYEQRGDTEAAAIWGERADPDG